MSNQTHRKTVRERLQSIAEEGVENVGKRTPSDPMETGCRGKSPSDRRETVCERLSKYTARYS